jgi:predicted nucleic acid-binding protein
MSVRSFLDSNILVYSDDGHAPKKKKEATELIIQCVQEKNGVISTQVIQEYFSVVTRKLKIDIDRARKKINFFGHMDVIPADYALILNAIDLHQLYSLSFWDALIVQTALVSKCSVLYSEDMQHGVDIRGLKIVNPFL